MSEKKMVQPKLRFKEFSSSWSHQKIGALLTEVSRPIELLDDEQYQLVTVKRRNEGVVPRAVLKGKQILVKNYFTIESGDFLISKRQVVHGATGLVPEQLNNAVVSNEYMVVRDNDEITSEFWSVIAKRPVIRKLFFISSYGVDIEKLVFDVKDWKKRYIIAPSVSEQNEITRFHKSLDTQLKLHQDKHRKLKELKKAMLSKMFPKDGSSVPEVRLSGFKEDWKDKILEEITVSYSGGTPTANNSSFYGGEIPFIRSGEIHSDRTELFITSKGLSNSSAKMVQVGTVLYALYGATSGEVAVSKIRGAINQAILAIHPKDGYSSFFIALWLLHKKSSIIATYLQGGQGNLSGAIIKKLNFIFPSYEEQEKIGEYFFNLDRLIALQQNQIDKLKNIKQACLKQMFV